MSKYYTNSSDQFDFNSLKSEKNVTTGLAILAAIGLLVGGWFWYRSYTVQQEQAAQKVLSSCLAEYEKLRAGGTPAQWQTLDAMCTAGYEKSKSTAMAPYFLAIRADALVEQGNDKEALELLQSMTNALPTSSSLYYPYKTKYALIKLDHVDDEDKTVALNELENLAYDSSNTNADYALYYLGEYYWHNNQTEQALKTWRDLESTYKTDTKNGQSPWALLAQYKLQQTVYES